MWSCLSDKMQPKIVITEKLKFSDLAKFLLWNSFLFNECHMPYQSYFLKKKKNTMLYWSYIPKKLILYALLKLLLKILMLYSISNIIFKVTLPSFVCLIIFCWIWTCLFGPNSNLKKCANLYMRLNSTTR
jgi:hypothetical protein